MGLSARIAVFALFIPLAFESEAPEQEDRAAQSWHLGDQPQPEPAPTLPAPTSPAAIPAFVRSAPSQETLPDAQRIALPNIIVPSTPGREKGTAGTGFFIAENGTLLTAAHVVDGCRKTQIVSNFVGVTDVTILARDAGADIALLRAPVYPPATLTLGTPDDATSRLLILGYPDSAGLKVAAETYGVLENARFPAAVRSLIDPRETLWMDAAEVTHGYSGGPVLDARTGTVMGIIKGTMSGYVKLVFNLPIFNLAVGPGVNTLGSFLKHEAPFLDLSAARSPDNDDTVANAHRATVHVLCWN